MFFSSKETQPTSPHYLKTKAAVLISELLNSPLSSICLCSSFILYKSLGGTPFQVGILTTLKPSVALLILYWSAAVHTSREKLMNNLIWAGILARAPFFIFPWIQSPWVFISCIGIYMFFHRAANPAWVEIMKMNLPDTHRGRIYSLASALSYAEGFLLSFWIQGWLTHNELAWRWLYPVAALIGMTSILVQTRLPLYVEQSHKMNTFTNWKSKVISPLSEALDLMKRRPDFRRFQIAFFLCGFGLMMASGVIPIFCVDILNASYQDYITAVLVCQGFGFVLTSRIWGEQLHQLHIFKIMAYVIICFILFGVFFLLTPISMSFFYVAYFIYGVGQAGSRLCWNLSGPIFSKEKNSTVYSSINILMVGIRGCIAPLLGTLLFDTMNAYFVVILFIILSLWALKVMLEGLSKTQVSE